MTRISPELRDIDYLEQLIWKFRSFEHETEINPMWKRVGMDCAVALHHWQSLVKSSMIEVNQADRSEDMTSLCHSVGQDE